MTQSSLISVEVVNIIARLQCKHFDMNEIKKIRGIRYNPGRFSGAFLRLSHGSCNIFRTGTVVFLGYKEHDEIDEAMLELVCLLGHQLQQIDETPVVVNMVCSFNAGMAVKLPAVREKLKQFNNEFTVEYEPELSNSMRIRSRKGSGCILIHGTGKGIATGFKNKSDAYAFVRTIANAVS